MKTARVDELSNSNLYAHSRSESNGPSGSAASVGDRPVTLLLGIPANDGVNQAAGGIVAASGINSLFAELQEDHRSQAWFEPAGNTEINPRLTSLAALPDRWVNYTGMDLIVLPLEELKELIDRQPQQWAAMRKAICAGANLVVYNVGPRWERLSELEKLVDVPVALAAAATTGPIRAAGNRPIRGFWSQPLQSGVPSGDDPTSAVAEAVLAAQKPLAPATPPFIWHALGRGEIVAVAEDHLLADGSFNWPWLLNSLGRPHWQWMDAMGWFWTPPRLEANQTTFWDFLIPGVGLTPVLGFQILKD